MNKNIFSCPAMILKFETRADKTNKVILNTQEISTEQRTALSELTGNFGYFVFASEDGGIENLEIPDSIPAFKDKTPSQRLRSVLYKVWEETQHLPFPIFYERELEKIIAHYQEKLH